MKLRDVCKMNLVTVKLFSLHYRTIWPTALERGMCVHLCGVDVEYHCWVIRLTCSGHC